MEITPAMIEAGVRVYRSHCPDSCDGGFFDEELIKEILLAALKRAKE